MRMCPCHWIGRSRTRLCGDVVIAALASLRKGGVVAINAIHLDRMPQFDYDRLLWGERQIRSVANMTRSDAHDFLHIADQIDLRPETTAFPLDRVNDALAAIKADGLRGAAVIVSREQQQWFMDGARIASGLLRILSAQPHPVSR